MSTEHVPGSSPASFSSGEKSSNGAQPETSFSMLSLLEASWRANGDVHEIPGEQYVLLSNPTDIHSVLTSRNFSEKGPLYNGVRKILGEGILTTSGAPWKESRRHILPSFRPTQINEMVDAMADIGEEFAQELRKRASEGPIDLQREMAALTLDTFRITLFGQHVAAEDLPSYDTLDAAFGLAGNLGGAQGSREEIRAKRAALRESLNATTQDLIDKARQQEPDGTLLSMLVNSTDKDGVPLDDQTISSELLIMMFAGHETSAATLTWLFDSIKARPDIMARMQQEGDEVLNGRKLQLEDLPKLVYTRQVIDEVLRLKPTVPLLARSASEETKIQDHIVQPGGIVLPFIWAAHRHPDFWENPEAFDPDRFSKENSAKRDKNAYLPFAAGNRICIGKGMALAELVTHTTILLQNLDVAVAPNNVTPDAHITLRPSEPIYANVTSR